MQARLGTTQIDKMWREYVKSGIGGARLARLMGISRVALYKRKLKGEMKPKRGRPTHFSAATEAQMAQYIISLANSFSAFTRVSFMRWAEHFSMTRLGNGDFEASEGWLRGFLDRNKSVVNRCVTSQTRRRLESFNRAAIEPFFEEIADIAPTFEPECIWNCDATGNTMNFKQKKVRAHNLPHNCFRTRNDFQLNFTLPHRLPSPLLQALGAADGPAPILIKHDMDAHVNFTIFASAAGEVFTAVATYKGKSVDPAIMAKEPGMRYHCNKNGWEDDHAWRAACTALAEHEKKAGRTRSLLYVDGAGQHDDPVALEILINANITLIVLRPGTTHVGQPLDVGVFGPLKSKTSAMARAAKVVLTTKNIQEWFRLSFETMAPNDDGTYARPCEMWAKRAFAKTGLYPFRVDYFKDADFELSDRMLGISPSTPEIVDRMKIATEARHKLTEFTMASLTPLAKDGLQRAVKRALEKKPMMQVRTGNVYLEAEALKQKAAEDERAAIEGRKAARAASAAAKRAALAQSRALKAGGGKVVVPAAVAGAVSGGRKRGRPSGDMAAAMGAPVVAASGRTVKKSKKS